jgi:hypothetical protein
MLKTSRMRPNHRIKILQKSSHVLRVVKHDRDIVSRWFRISMTTWDKMEQLVTELEELQRRKVLDLARRLRPGLTLEDVRNPHDFPELDDPDWQHADGVLVGIQSVLAAVRACRRDDEAGGHEEKP